MSGTVVQRGMPVRLASRAIPQGTGLSILTRGILLVTVPLVFQLAFVGAYFSLRMEMERALRWAADSQRTTSAAQELHRRTSEALGALRGYRLRADSYFLDVHDRNVARIPGLLDQLRGLVDAPDEREHVERIATHTDRLLDQFRRERERIAEGGTEGFAMVRMPALREEISRFVDRQLAEDAARAAELERVHKRQAGLIGTFFVAGLILTFTSAYLFSRGIGARLAHLTESTRRIAAGLDPLPAVQGADEIAELDAAFRSMADEIHRRNSQLLASNRELESFAAVASHDLQEPLRKIEAFGDRLATRYADALDDQGRDYIARMRSAASRMRQLIDGLLRYSRVATRQRPPVDVDLSQVAREVVADLETSIERAQATVEVGPLPSLEADPDQMRQLLQNLVGNALKFRRPEVPLVVRIHGELLPPQLPATVSHVRLVVEDNGLGFEQQYSGRIFELFQRLHGRSHSEGVGLGLAICRRIAERHGGTIAAEGAPHEGARFIVTLPSVQPVEDQNRAD